MSYPQKGGKVVIRNTGGRMGALYKCDFKKRNGSMQMNVDKGNQGNVGKDGIVTGDVANSNTDCSTRRYELKTLDSAEKPFCVNVGSDATLWIYVGTDSGFESGTSPFYTNVTIIPI